MMKKWKNIRPGLLVAHIVITLAYPALKAYRSPDHQLLIFTNALTIIACVLLILGIIYSMVLHGDFDISSYFYQRSVRAIRHFFLRRGKDEDPQKEFLDYLSDSKEEREESFNYPLLLGIVYLIGSAVVAYTFL